MTTNAIHTWYISFMKEKLDNNYTYLIQTINLCIQRIENLIDTHDDYVSMCEQFKKIIKYVHEHTNYSNDEINKMINNIDDKEIKVYGIVLYHLEIISETKNQSMNTTSDDLYHKKICNREYLDKINTFLNKILIKSIKVFNRVKAIEDYQIEILDKMSMIKNIYNIQQDHEGKFFIPKELIVVT